MTSVGGHSRFSGPGSQWKSSWRRSVPYSEMFLFEGFNSSFSLSQWYQLNGGIPIVPANGIAIGAVVGLSGSGIEVQPLRTIIAKSGNVANQGWLLSASVTPVFGSVDFTFTVFDGAGVAATTTVGGGGVVPVDPQYGVDRVLYQIAAYFIPPGVYGPNGAISLCAGTSGASLVPLASAYVNATPFLRIGVGAPNESLRAPNGLHGLSVADGIPGNATQTQLGAVWLDWATRTQQEQQCVGFGTNVFPGVVNINGWRANNPILGPGDAPSPLSPFAGVQDLVFGDVTHPPLVVTETAAVFREDLLSF